MTLYEFFMKYYQVLCFLYLNAAIIAVLLPSRICRTETINKHWILVFMVMSGLLGLRQEYLVSFTLLGFMFSGIAVHYIRIWHKKKMASYSVIHLPDTQNPIYKRVK